MIVVCFYDIDDETVQDILKQDMHAQDLIDQINREAEASDPIDIFHLSDDQYEAAVESISMIYRKPITNSVIEKL